MGSPPDAEWNYAYLNRAHTEIHGHSSPGDLIGRSWKVLHDEEAAQRFQEKIWPVLRYRGRWRGSLGQEGSGTRAPHEVSISLLDEGGMICASRRYNGS